MAGEGGDLKPGRSLADMVKSMRSGSGDTFDGSKIKPESVVQSDAVKIDLSVNQNQVAPEGMKVGKSVVEAMKDMKKNRIGYGSSGDLTEEAVG